ncbi:phenylalanyl-tRNA synthetase [Gonapodya prolifera JEL478]|uniref:Phenylalanine--tRNA ligase, mitochondrial n=1 Tax=Gonapodya prolifera (strain JEL478) TaxID=1344416 RepID=A0A139A254_GONPJ|nr:phenylalanyl-tRNA synthetase [Gonapodya prolifera JEL478]|eukprot:KXS10857.1 phenylalanyl-tRNA synthetase [Gonapodya prolifera JEL478]
MYPFNASSVRLLSTIKCSNRVMTMCPVKRIDVEMTPSNRSSTWDSRSLFSTQNRFASSAISGQAPEAKQSSDSQDQTSTITIAGSTYTRDDCTNVPGSIAAAASRRIHHLPTNPVGIFRRLVEKHFRTCHTNVFRTFDDIHPVVTPKANFDTLLFPSDHPSRGPSDTYYVNRDLILRTHSSAHQAQLLAQGNTDFLLTADVYRRDEIDRSHYPAFHQMEGVRTFARDELPPLPPLSLGPSIELIDETSAGSSKNPIQSVHTKEESALVAADLKRTLNGMLLDIFGPLLGVGKESVGGPSQLKIRWVDAYFPFTAPSYEVEVWYQGKWLEVLGSGVTRQEILDGAGHSDRVGWAFGLGIERLAMVLFRIPDIRLFWSGDDRFLSQFEEGKVTEFKAYSKYPACYKDVSFWLPSAIRDDKSAKSTFVENDFMEIVRDEAGDLVEDVAMVDEFTNPTTNRTSRCYRINYRSMDRNLTNDEINVLHRAIEKRAEVDLGVEVR